jgi:hypothetical protein
MLPAGAGNGVTSGAARWQRSDVQPASAASQPTRKQKPDCSSQPARQPASQVAAASQALGQQPRPWPSLVPHSRAQHACAALPAFVPMQRRPPAHALPRPTGRNFLTKINANIGNSAVSSSIEEVRLRAAGGARRAAGGWRAVLCCLPLHTVAMPGVLGSRRWAGECFSRSDGAAGLLGAGLGLGWAWGLWCRSRGSSSGLGGPHTKGRWDVPGGSAMPVLAKQPAAAPRWHGSRCRCLPCEPTKRATARARPSAPAAQPLPCSPAPAPAALHLPCSPAPAPAPPPRTRQLITCCQPQATPRRCSTPHAAATIHAPPSPAPRTACPAPRPHPCRRWRSCSGAPSGAQTRSWTCLPAPTSTRRASGSCATRPSLWAPCPSTRRWRRQAAWWRTSRGSCSGRRCWSRLSRWAGAQAAAAALGAAVCGLEWLGCRGWLGGRRVGAGRSGGLAVAAAAGKPQGAFCCYWPDRHQLHKPTARHCQQPPPAAHHTTPHRRASTTSPSTPACCCATSR